jgi:hypothetical protein
VSTWTAAVLIGSSMIAGGVLTLAACMVWLYRNRPRL